jgi:hypothetical protein
MIPQNILGLSATLKLCQTKLEHTENNKGSEKKINNRLQARLCGTKKQGG